DLFASLADEFAQLRERLEETEAGLMTWHRSNECCRRLAKIPGVGPIGAVLLVMKAPAPEQLAAGMGLTPWDHSTAGKVRPGVITRAGDEALCKTLAVGAASLLRQAGTGRGRNASPWLIDLLKRKPPKFAAVALVNKIARITWKMMMSGEAYKNTAARPAAA
ncbi:transposase, partial [Leisingera sp. HS039]|uniref:transposase n=1 Tax=Leisingera sp. HS039 TaxID=2818496 RepID=UPI001B3A059C